MRYNQNFKAPPVADMKINQFIQSCKEQFQKIAEVLNRGHDDRSLAYLSANQLNIQDQTTTIIELDTVAFNPGGHFDVSGYKHIIKTPGKYWLAGCIGWVDATLVADKMWFSYIFKNSTAISTDNDHSSHTGALRVPVFASADLEEGDEITLRCWHNAGVDTPDIIGGDVKSTFLTVQFLR